MYKGKIRGQGMTEYIIIVALIAVSAIGVYSFFGKTIRNQVAGLATEMSGVDSSAQIGAAKTAAGTTSTVATVIITWVTITLLQIRLRLVVLLVVQAVINTSLTYKMGNTSGDSPSHSLKD